MIILNNMINMDIHKHQLNNTQNIQKPVSFTYSTALVPRLGHIGHISFDMVKILTMDMNQ